VDLVNTDPPYKIAMIKGFGYQKNRSYADRPYIVYEDWLPLISQVAKLNSSVYIFEHNRQVGSLWGELRKYWAIQNQLIWNVTNRQNSYKQKYYYSAYDPCLFATRGDYTFNWLDIPMKDVWTSANVQNEIPIYGIKPEGFIDRCILANSNEGDLILDPFLGSGTTAYCAKKLNRRCIGIEIEERYCEIAANRCRQMVFDLR